MRKKLNPKILKFAKYLEEGAKRGPSLMSFSQILQRSFKAIYRDLTKIESSKLRTMYIFLGEKFDLPSFFQSLWRHEVKIGLMGAKFVCYISIVIKRSNSITMVFSRLVIHF